MSDYRAWLTITFAVSVSSLLSAAMPRLPVELFDAIDSTISSGRTFMMGTDDSLQSALDQAKSGDTIVLLSGATYEGPFVLRNHGGPGWITIISSAAKSDSFPRAGTRVSPQDAAAMATLTTTRDVIIRTDPGAGRYHFIGVELTPVVHSLIATLVELSSGDNNNEMMPHHIIFERSYLHGDPELATRRGIVMNGAHIAVIDSHLSGFKSVEDAQALVSWEGTGPFLIRNNYLEATGENIMFGGADPGVEGRVPSDITVSGNHFSKPLLWQRSHPSYDGSVWSVKNLLELKNAQHVQIDGNLFEHNWPQAQNGFAILFTVRNQDGRSAWSRVQNVTFSNNIVRHVGAGISILGQDDNHPSERTQGLTIDNNLFYDVGNDWGQGRLLQILNNPANITLSNNTAMQSNAIMWLESDPIIGVNIQNNIFLHNETGFSGTNTAPGMQSLDAYLATPSVIMGNILIGCGQTRYQHGMSCVRNVSAMSFENEETNDFRLIRSSSRPATARRNRPGVDFELLCAALSPTERPAYCTL